MALENDLAKGENRLGQISAWLSLKAASSFQRRVALRGRVQTMYCAQCGNQLPDAAKCCLRCGKSVDAASSVNSPKRRHKAPLWALVLVTLLMLVTVLAVHFLRQYEAEKRKNEGQPQIRVATQDIAPTNPQTPIKVTPQPSLSPQAQPSDEPGGGAPPPSLGSDSIQRVRFPRGRTTVVLRGSIVNDGMNQYLLRARAGQKMTVHITSPRNTAKFDVYLRADRSVLANSRAEDTTDWQGQLPESGDYCISVYSGGGTTGYTLEVTIR